jgi:hypothetical protein
MNQTDKANLLLNLSSWIDQLKKMEDKITTEFKKDINQSIAYNLFLCRDYLESMKRDVEKL